MTTTAGPATPGRPFPASHQPLLRVRGLGKSFGATRALHDVSLDVAAGEVVAIVGHNGSGKSTLVKILAGAYPRDDGSIEIADDVTFHVIHQDLGLVGSLTAIENIDLVRPHRGPAALRPIRPRSERRDAGAVIARFGVDVPLDVPVARLTAAQQALVAIGRALDGWRADERHILVLDEPTAALHAAEVETLLAAVRTLAADGVGILYISHRLAEVVDLADRALVLKDGRCVAELNRGDFDHGRLVDLISGRVTEAAPAEPRRAGATILGVRGLRAEGLDSVDLDVRNGEIVGIAGVIGSGAEHLLGAIFGAIPRHAGVVTVGGRPHPAGDPAASIAARVGFVPADRRGRAAILEWSARENLTLPRLRDLRTRWGSLDVRAERAVARDWAETVGLKPQGATENRFAQFSGGNQQKIVIAKWLRLEPALLMLDEPTQGVDAGAQADLHTLIVRAAARGTAVAVFSTDAKELAGLCDRVVVLDAGRVVEELSGRALSEPALVAAILRDRAASAPERTTP